MPLGMESAVAVFEMEHEQFAVVEACKVGGPDELLFALFVEVDAVGNGVVGRRVGERLLDSEVGDLALREVVEHAARVRGVAEGGFWVDASHCHHTVEDCGIVLGQAINKALGTTLFPRTLKYVASTVTNGYSSLRGLSLNSLTFTSNSLQASDTDDFEKLVPHSVSITFATFLVDTPLTTISAIVLTRAASLVT